MKVKGGSGSYRLAEVVYVLDDDKFYIKKNRNGENGLFVRKKEVRDDIKKGKKVLVLDKEGYILAKTFFNQKIRLQEDWGRRDNKKEYRGKFKQSIIGRYVKNKNG